MPRVVLYLVLLAVSFVSLGCHPEYYNNLAPATLEQINLVVNDDDLEAAEKRSQLEQLGIDAATVNALLAEERTVNQFGGDLRTAYVKVTEPNFRALTPDEIQVYGDGASEVDATITLELTDQEAQAIADFFDEENLSSAEGLEAYLDDPSNEVPEEIPDGVLRNLFVDFDPDELLPILP